mgnify:FL=1
MCIGKVISTEQQKNNGQLADLLFRQRYEFKTNPLQFCKQICTFGDVMDGHEMLTLSKAAKLFPSRNGKTVHLKTLCRRIRVGSRGVRLRAINDGGRWFTCADWVREFLDAQTSNATAGRLHPSAVDEDDDRAAAELLNRWGMES